MNAVEISILDLRPYLFSIFPLLHSRYLPQNRGSCAHLRLLTRPLFKDKLKIKIQTSTFEIDATDLKQLSGRNASPLPLQRRDGGTENPPTSATFRDSVATVRRATHQFTFAWPVKLRAARTAEAPARLLVMEPRERTELSQALLQATQGATAIALSLSLSLSFSVCLSLSLSLLARARRSPPPPF